jgi:hypothetical protein
MTTLFLTGLALHFVAWFTAKHVKVSIEFKVNCH